MSKTGGKPTEKKDEKEPSLFSAATTWNSFWDSIKEQYYPVESYEDNYIQWTTLRQQRDKREPSFLSATPTWNSFQDDIKEQYNPLGSYNDKYIQ